MGAIFLAFILGRRTPSLKPDNKPVSPQATSAKEYSFEENIPATTRSSPPPQASHTPETTQRVATVFALHNTARKGRDETIPITVNASHELALTLVRDLKKGTAFVVEGQLSYRGPTLASRTFGILAKVVRKDHGAVAQFEREPPRIHRSLTVAIALRDKTVCDVVSEGKSMFLDEESSHFKAEVSSKNTYHFRHIEERTQCLDRLGQFGSEVRDIGTILLKDVTDRVFNLRSRQMARYQKSPANP